MIAQTTSTFLTIAISWERHTAICHPLQSYRLPDESTTYKAILALLLLACAVNVPEIYKTALHVSEKWCIVGWTLWDAVIKILVPLVLLGYFNVHIFLEVLQ